MQVEGDSVEWREFTTPVPRVIIADNDVLLREGLASLLTHSGLDVTGPTSGGPRLLSQMWTVHPDVGMVGIRILQTKTTEGLDPARWTRTELPDTGSLVLSAHVEGEQATVRLSSGHGARYLLNSRVTDAADFVVALFAQQAVAGA